MKAIITFQNLASDIVMTIWTPMFVAIFLGIVAYTFWPRGKADFDEAASLPLREE